MPSTAPDIPVDTARAPGRIATGQEWHAVLLASGLLLLLTLCWSSGRAAEAAKAAADTGPPTLTNDWGLIVRDSVICSPAIGDDGTIYFGSFRGRFWAVDPEGRKKWIFQAGREIGSTPAIGADGTIYFGCRDHKVYAITTRGKGKWTFTTRAWVDSSPAIGADGTVYVGSWDQHFYALTPEGTKKWEFATAGPIVSSPAIAADGTIYFGSHDGKFYALRPDGTRTWAHATGGPIISSPALDKDGTIYFTSVDGFFHALNADGSLKWRLKTGGITESSPVIGQDGTLYVGVNTGIWAISADGRKKWTRPLELGFIECAPTALADNSVCWATTGGVLLDLDSQNPAASAKWQFLGVYSHPSPTVGPQGEIYTAGDVTNIGGTLYALPGCSPLAPSPWPKFRGNARNTGRAADENRKAENSR